MIEDQVLVSVVVSTYRRDKTLRNALQSLQNQTFRSFEIVVVDDNGDESRNRRVREIVGEFGDLNIRLVCNFENLGSAKSRNLGIDAAAGEYVSFLDDDDEYLPEKLEKQYAFMKDGGYDYSLTDLDLFYEDGRLSEHRRRNYIVSCEKDDLLRYHLMYQLTGTDTLMFRKEYIQKIGGFGPKDIGDEFYLMHRAIESGGKFGYLPRCDVKAYVHMGDESLSSGEKKIKAENEIYRYKKQYFPKLDRKSRKYITMRHYAVLAFAEYRRGNKGAFLKYGFRSFAASPVNCIGMTAKLAKR